jgi:hypothetical protein
MPAVGFPRFVCPSSHPWLRKGDLSPGRFVPNGIQVFENGGVGVSINPATTDRGLVTGYAHGSATNYTFWSQEVLVYAYCTNNRDDAYRG